jgi:hypothetical protein
LFDALPGFPGAFVDPFDERLVIALGAIQVLIG